MKLQTPGQTDPIYWAVLGYARWWLNIDAGLRQLVGDAGGKLTEGSLAAIALQYNVARGLPGKDRPTEALAVLDVLNRSAVNWPTSISGRAQRCSEIVEKLQVEKLTDKNHVSGVTKYMWFLHPVGWTVFDRFAADGMGIPSGMTTLDRMKKFYAALDAAGFETAERQLQSLIDKSDWKSLPAGRVLDTLLMRRSSESGMREGANSKAAINGFLLALPPDAAKSLHDLATTAQQELGQDPLSISRGN